MLTVSPDSVLLKQISSGEETPLIAIKGDDGKWRYYDNCLYVFAFLALSGNYKIWA